MDDPKVYYDLTESEKEAIAVYIDCNDKALINQIIDEGNMTKDFKRFVTKLINGERLRPPRAKPSTIIRDAEIHAKINKLLDEGYKLTSNRSDDGAAAIVAGQYKGVSADVAAKAYNRMEKLYSEAAIEVLEELGINTNIK
jgi:hypothetical protein